jgi:prevent-host-death family protein
MTTITSLDLRNNLQEYLLAASNGQEFLVTLRGKPVANISSQNNSNSTKIKPKSGKAFLEYLKNRQPVDYSDSPVFNMTVKETKEYIRSEKAKKYGYE